MKSVPLSHRLTWLIPSATVLVLVFAGHMLMPERLSHVTPPLFLLAFYFWAIFHPALVPWPVLFVAAIFADIASGYPLGMTALLAMMFAWMVRGQRRFLSKQNFVHIWWRLCIILMLIFVLLYVGMSLYMLRWPAWTPLLMQFVATILLYPPLHYAFYIIKGIMPDER